MFMPLRETGHSNAEAGGERMEQKQLESIGENLRSLGHERRQVVEQIVEDAQAGSGQARRLYQELDRISEQAIDLMERQRDLIRQEFAGS